MPAKTNYAAKWESNAAQNGLRRKVGSGMPPKTDYAAKWESECRPKQITPQSGKRNAAQNRLRRKMTIYANKKSQN